MFDIVWLRRPRQSAKEKRMQTRGGKIALAIVLFLAMVGVAVMRGQMREPEQFPGITTSTIRVGNTMTYSGNLAAYGAVGRALTAYVRQLNKQGGIQGRRIELLSVDDAYNPTRTVEATRRLVEEDSISFMLAPLGTASNLAIRNYLNEKQVPHLFAVSGASLWADPQRYPWTIAGYPSYVTEARIYTQYVLQHIKDAKIAMLYQNDTFGRDYRAGVLLALGDAAKGLLIIEQTYEATDASVHAQMVNLKNSGANVFFDFAAPRFAIEALKKTHEMGWRPQHFLTSTANSVDAVMAVAGSEATRDVVSLAYFKDPHDPQWQPDAGFQQYLAFAKEYVPNQVYDQLTVLGYTLAQMGEAVLKQAGSDLSRENIMKQAMNLHELSLPMLLPGTKINTAPNDYQPFKAGQLCRFDGHRWVLFGEMLNNTPRHPPVPASAEAN